MGNTSSGKNGRVGGGGGSAVAQRVSQAGRTGVCTLREQKLTEVGRLPHCKSGLEIIISSLVPRPFIDYERPGYEARNYEDIVHPYPQIPSHPHTLTSPHPHILTVSTAAPGDEGISEDTRPLHQQTGPSSSHHWRLHHPTLSQPLPQQTRLVRQPLPQQTRLVRQPLPARCAVQQHQWLGQVTLQ